MEGDIYFEVPGEVVAKGRPRLTTINGSASAFTPKKTATYESHVRFAASAAMKGRDPLDGPLMMRVVCWRPVLKSMSRKNAAAALAGSLLPVTRPDVDNYAKSALDACNGVVFVDDAQVVELVAVKRYGDRPRLTIEVMTLAPS